MGRFLCTGGCGFIGSHLVDLILDKGHKVVILDALSWGSNIKNLRPHAIVGGISGQVVPKLPKDELVLMVGDVADAKLVKDLVNEVDFDGIFHLAAQTHVDRSYGDVLPFVNSNMIGAYSVLEAIREFPGMRLVFMSTDEVYGDVTEGFSTETDPIAPRNVYSALKAGGDLLAQTYAAVFGLDIVIARPANNYGPRQFEEKLIPKILSKLLPARDGRVEGNVPVYGDGQQIRDWLYVRDTALGLWEMYSRGQKGGIYNLGAHQFQTVLQVIQKIADILGLRWEDHVVYVPDRIRGDRRYALDLSKTKDALDWQANTKFMQGLVETVNWYAEQRRTAAGAMA